MVDPSGLERELEGTPAEDAGILLDLGLTPEEVRGVLEQHQSVFRDGWAAGACTELAKATFSRMKALKAKGKLGNLTPAIWTVQKRHGMSEGIQGTQEDHHFVVLLKPSGGVGAFMDHRLFIKPDIWAGYQQAQFERTMWWSYDQIGPQVTKESFNCSRYMGEAPYKKKRQLIPKRNLGILPGETIHTGPPIGDRY